MKALPRQTAAVRAYVESQVHDESVVHLELVASESVGPVVHDIWDVHCTNSRWWVVTEPTNFYSQDDFKSRDVVLTFHIGLALRLLYQEERQVPVTEAAALLLQRAWRLWDQAAEALGGSREAEDFQAVGVRLRECMVTFVGEVADECLVPTGAETPKRADVVGWTNLLADHLTAGSSMNEQLRSYIKKMTRETWDYVNKLTHAKNAGHYDAEIGVAAVSHFLSTITAARMRWSGGDHHRCEACGSYRVVGGTCVRCGWADPAYQEQPRPEISEEELAQRLAEPHSLSFEISTYVSPTDYLRRTDE